MENNYPEPILGKDDEMKRFLSGLRRAVAALLMLTMLCGVLSQAAFAEYGRVFVSEVHICISASRQEAVACLEQEGYTVVEQNLNEGTGDAALFVFLGYKTTRDPEKALTDIAVLNMNGDYAYTDVFALSRLCGKQLTDAVRAVQVSAAALAAAYQAGAKPAVWGYETLNRFRDVESDRPLGDLLLSEPSDETVERILSKAELTSVSLIFAILYIGNGTADGKALVSSLNGVAPTAGSANAGALLSAERLLSDWDSIAGPLGAYRSAPTKWTADEETLDDYLLRLNDRELRNYLFGGALEAVAGEVRAADGQSLADFICRGDLRAEQLCFLVNAMSEGQRALAAYLTPDVLLFAGCDPTKKGPQPETPDDGGDGTGTGKTEETGETKPQSETTSEHPTVTDSEEEGTTGEETPAEEPEKLPSVPLQAGLSDRLENYSYLALTNETVQYIRENADLRWFWGEWEEPVSRTELLSVLASSVYSDVFTNTFRVAYGVTLPTASEEDEDALLGLWRERGRSDYMKRTYSELTGIRMTEVPYLWEMSAVSAVAIHALYNGGMDVPLSDLPQYKRIPAGTVQIRADSDFTIYNGVSQTLLAGERADLASLADVSGPRADLNGWSGRQWNALYVTKDPKAGKPILSDNICALADLEQSGLERSFAHAFGESVPYNLNRYATEDSLGGLYLYFDRLTEYGEKTPTIFTATDLRLAIVGGSLGGIIIGAVAAYVGYECKKRKQQEKEKR